MYDIALRPEDENFLDESFVHLEKELFLSITGQVLDTQKRIPDAHAGLASSQRWRRLHL